MCYISSCRRHDFVPRDNGFRLMTSSPLPEATSVMWRGLSRLSDIQIGVDIGAENVGN